MKKWKNNTLVLSKVDELSRFTGKKTHEVNKLY